MKKKGFTLIELLSVIIVLAIIALIAVPIVLNVVENAKKGANKNSVYGLLDAAKLYYVESLLDINKTTNGKTNLIDKITVTGNKPDSGAVYINNKGETALAVIYDNICYKKNFSENDLTQSEDVENCSLGIEEIPEVSYKCKRATVLHTEECTQTSSDKYCSAAGYTGENTTITYGSLGTKGTLISGDAFDCDVNGDGLYNSETERFYYVSDSYDTSSKTFNDNYAVLVYYNNTTLGISNNTSASNIAYDSSNENWHGPVTAISNLPTTIQWGNVSLSNSERAILNEKGTDLTGGGTLPDTFNYVKEVDGQIVPLAARLLTYQEIAIACSENGDPTLAGELDSCNYLLENTKYSNNSIATYGPWIESSCESNDYDAWYIGISTRIIYYDEVDNYSLRGVRPAIEILKTDMEI